MLYEVITDPFQFRQAGTAIGAGAQRGPDLLHAGGLAARDGVADDIDANAEAGADKRAGIGVPQITAVLECARITSYNVCYTKLLRFLAPAGAGRRRPRAAGLVTRGARGRFIPIARGAGFVPSVPMEEWPNQSTKGFSEHRKSTPDFPDRSYNFV